MGYPVICVKSAGFADFSYCSAFDAAGKKWVTTDGTTDCFRAKVGGAFPGEPGFGPGLRCQTVWRMPPELGVGKVLPGLGFLELARFENFFAIQALHKLAIVVVSNDLDASMGTGCGCHESGLVEVLPGRLLGFHRPVTRGEVLPVGTPIPGKVGGRCPVRSPGLFMQSFRLVLCAIL